MLSLNGMRPFGGRLNTKTVRAWPKADNIISFRGDVTYGIRVIAQPEMGERAQAHRSHQRGR
jgi:cell division GTPase FtsZ